MRLETILNHPVLKPIADFIYPPLCAGCGDFTERPHAICDRCRARFDLYTKPFCLSCRTMFELPICDRCRERTRPLFAYGNYVDPLKQMIIEAKFHSVTPPLEFLAGQLAAQFGGQLSCVNAECLIPVPLHPDREYARGYNQAELIAHTLSAQLGLPVRCDLVRRIARRKPQQKLPAARRPANIRGVFEALDVPESGLNVIIVDDVVTSGHTVGELARILESAGCRVMAVAALVHGE